MNVPVSLKLALLAVGTTAFYTYVGQLVPQKEVHPPQVTEIKKDVSTEEMVAIGQEIFNGKGICVTCHTLGRSGALRFPDLEGIGARAASQVPGMSALDYLAQSLYEPNVFIVPGYSPGMPAANKPPIGLTDDEILTVIAYLQSLGSTPSVTLETRLAFGPNAVAAGEAAPAAAEEAAPAPASGGATVLDQFGCTTCHYLDQPGELRGPSLYDIGARQDSNQILLEITNHPVPDEGPQDLERATLNDIREMARLLTDLKGN